MTPILEITGNVRERFVQAATLLYLLDPVRGEPTTYGLDQDAPNLQEPKDRALKRKFLDSFALICATRQDRDAVSAACLEEGKPEGTVVRIASNAGVSEETLSRLRSILNLLQSISNEVPCSSSSEREVLSEIIQLDLAKIKKYVQNLQRANGAFEETILSLKSRLREAVPDRIVHSIPPFLEWFGQIYAIRNLSLDPDPSIILDHIKWAQKAKSHHRDLLIFAFSKGNHLLPRWVQIVFKLGRYGIAAKALVRTACEIPTLFNPIFVEPVIAPPPAQFIGRNEETPLSCVLRRLGPINQDATMHRLAGIWGSNDPEPYFRKSYPAELTAHAEIQIVNFYDHNPGRTPRLRFIGVSKKTCYLCFIFLANHPSGFCVSSCHQKIYLSWIPPPATSNDVYKHHRTMTKDMSIRMEVIARQSLLDRGFGSRRSPVPADSTFGVSLTGLSDLGSLESVECGSRDHSYEGLEGNADTEQSNLSSHAEVANAPRRDKLVSLVSPSLDLDRVVSHDPDYFMARKQSLGLISQESLSSMVFHFISMRDKESQDIIMIDSVLDPKTHLPSWSKLVDILNQNDEFELLFCDSDILIVNNHLRVRNERQFVACLQYLLNAGVLNSDIMICHGRRCCKDDDHEVSAYREIDNSTTLEH